jgi:imidazolonepropionase-like amidohydrolase
MVAMTSLRKFTLAAAAAALWLAPLPAQSPGTTAFTGARLIDGTTAAPIANATILVRSGRIVAAGRAGTITVPPDARRVELTGKTVIPGLVNAHGHVGDTSGLEANRYSADNVTRDLKLYAAYGITTVVSLGGDQQPSFAARDSQRTPALDRARLFVAGPVLAPKTPHEARTQVDQVAASKADIVKIRVDDNLGTTAKMTPEVYRAVIDQAHKDGMRTAVHLFYLSDAKAVLEAGADFIAHSVRDTAVDDAFIAAMKKRDVCYCPTLMREVSTYVYESTPAFFDDPFFLKHADRQLLDTLKEPARQSAMRNSAAAQAYKKALGVANANLKKLSDAGVAIAMGTDTGPPARFQGYFEQLELEMMVKAGLTPRQVLASATRDAARCMQLDREVGTLEAGKWADFVVLDADPLTDIKATRSIVDVYIAGNKAAR